MDKPTIGRIVHYVDGHHHSRPAIVTAVLEHDESTIHLAAFFPTNFKFVLNVKNDADKEPGTWHWPPREKGGFIRLPGNDKYEGDK